MPINNTSSTLIRNLLLINLIVFLFWNIQTAVFWLPRFMFDHFLVSWTGLVEGRFWILITSVFSHRQVWHLLMNMFVLYSFGRVVESVLGSYRFLKFYIIAGIISSLSHAVVSRYLLNEASIPALGASGAISGVILLFALMFPKEKLYILGIVPLPAIWGAILFVGLDLWGLFSQFEGGGFPIGHGAHLGGALTGFIYYLFLRRQNRNQRSLS